MKDFADFHKMMNREDPNTIATVALRGFDPSSCKTEAEAQMNANIRLAMYFLERYHLWINDQQ